MRRKADWYLRDWIARGHVPNAFCPNPLPGALDCAAFAPHGHCVCGLPIDEGAPPAPCFHDPLDRIGLKLALARFPSQPLVYSSEKVAQPSH